MVILYKCTNVTMRFKYNNNNNNNINDDNNVKYKKTRWVVTCNRAKV